MRAKFEIAEIGDSHLLLVDLDGPKSITNDAEAVVEYLYKGDLLDEHRLYYIDTDGIKTELIHDGQGHFTRFGFEV